MNHKRLTAAKVQCLRAAVIPARLIRRLARRSGWDIVPYSISGSANMRRRVLLDALNITTVVDIGANAGQYGRELRRAGYKRRIVSFEPLPTAFNQLHRIASRDDQWICEQVAIGKSDGRTRLHVAGNSLSSSILPMLESHIAAEPRSAYTTSIAIPLRRLDALMPRFVTAEDRLWVKLDVQGYELPVLHGGQETIGRAQVVECELSLAPLYEGETLYREMIDHLSAQGFELVGMDPGFTDPRSGRLLQFDGVFARAEQS